MTSYNFEVAAKNAVIQVMKLNTTIDKLELVWFAHELGYKKCTIWGSPMGIRYAEITYNKDNDEMYVDIYQKISNTLIPGDKLNFKAMQKRNEYMVDLADRVIVVWDGSKGGTANCVKYAENVGKKIIRIEPQNRECIVGGKKYEYGEFKSIHDYIGCVMSLNWRLCVAM